MVGESLRKLVAVKLGCSELACEPGLKDEISSRLLKSCLRFGFFAEFTYVCIRGSGGLDILDDALLSRWSCASW